MTMQNLRKSTSVDVQNMWKIVQAQKKKYKSHLGVYDGVKKFMYRRCRQKFVCNSELLKHRKDCRSTS